MNKIIVSCFIFLFCATNCAFLEAQPYQTEFHSLINKEEFKENINYNSPLVSEKIDFAKVILRTSFSGGNYLLNSNQEYIDRLNLSKSVLKFDLEVFPLKNFGLGVSTGNSNLRDTETGHLIQGSIKARDVYAIIRTDPLNDYRGYIGLYFGAGRAEQSFIEADPEFYQERISGNGNSGFVGIVLQTFGVSRLGWTLDVSYRNINTPKYYFANGGEEFLTFADKPQLMNSTMEGFNFKLGIALLLY